MEDYKEAHHFLSQVASNLNDFISEGFADFGNIDRIQVRPKGLESFYFKSKKKLSDNTLKYNEPLHQIQDQIGARIVIFYKRDIEQFVEKSKKIFRPIEDKDKKPESDYEFNYFGRHMVFFLPDEVMIHYPSISHKPNFFELQIKTLFEHAWSEASHDLIYKGNSKSLPENHKRLLALASAQAWGADRIFDELCAGGASPANDSS